MRTILFIIKKELLQILRNKQMIPIIFLLPIFQLLVLVHAATFEIKKVDMVIVNKDNSNFSRLLINKFISTNYFKYSASTYSDEQAKKDLAILKARMILEIPGDFEKNLINTGKAKVQFIINAEDGAAAAVIQSYASSIVIGFNQEIIADFKYNLMRSDYSLINTITRYWYNPELDYKHYMVPGILVLLVTVVGMFLSSMNIVREKEIGTIEQLNVTPIRKRHFIVGKLLPFWLLANFELILGLIIGKFVFDVPIEGNILLIFFLASTYLLVVQAIGLFISTIAETQQQALFLSWFFMVLFMLMSGLFTPIDSMPGWAQIITLFNPVAHFIEIMRRVLLKGSGFFEVQKQFWLLIGLVALMITLATWRYRKTTG
ncbi:MAG: ABC transporter permease [Bacteroidetes bacterium]|nr:MAG: ABC transporter permease [Bacteroidota bacterium]